MSSKLRHRAIGLAVLTLVALGTLFVVRQNDGDSPTSPPCATGRAAADIALNLTFETDAVIPPYDDYVDEQGSGRNADHEVVAEPARTGEGALRLRLPASDGEKSRRQLRVPDLSFESGDDLWYGISVYVDEDWNLEQVEDNAELFGSIFSFRWRDISTEANGPGNGIMLDRLEDGQPHFIARRETRGWEYADGGGADTIDLGPVRKGQWTDFVIHIRWSDDPETGLREYWRDGRLMGRSAKQTMATDSPVINRIGLYQGSAVDQDRTLYWDNHRIGGSYAEVNPACP
jgi:hypothetical protein